MAESEVEVLPGLAAELTCAICLELLQEPVTAPCGHNFCQDCLALYWADERVGLSGFSCPQCRCHWAQRPDLRPNRVLCTVVAGLERVRAEPGDGAQPAAKSGAAVPCDACPPDAAAPALRTCLTCLASFCAEHLKPHQQSPALRSHSLRLPLHDLAQRRCPSHGKLLEFRCCQHGDCLCAVCLLDHRGCSTGTEEEARLQREEELKVQQKTVEYQIIQLQHSLELMQFQKEHVKDSSVTQKSAVAGEFAEMKAMIEREEKVAAKLIEEEENKAESRCVEVLDQMNGQLEKLKEYKEQLKSVLAHTGGIAFWKVVAELPQVSLDAPTSQQQIEVDARKLVLITKAVSVLRGKLVQQLKFPLDQRVRQMEQAGSTLDPEPKSAGAREPSEVGNLSEDKPGKSKKTKNKPPQTSAPNQPVNLGKPRPNPHPTSARRSDEAEKQKKLPTSSTPAPQKRQDFVQYNSKVTFNQRSAHKKLVLSDRYTSVSVSEQPQVYPDLPERFFNCCQVLGLQWFANGRHYGRLALRVTASGRLVWHVLAWIAVAPAVAWAGTH
ncbi:E3 ubiquitin/ISG15 ligase TRIM25 isoform X2 [Pristis pectinata]|uniref:E3 ubiquitin/ISG15 ligase TRIM25 isoform X2 n=1 Tax=Pristis pectinata TaxID=685728 RepID=UPI00223D7498|nr:E3 ubiquitin/ISG15 ligase TRIM25 isoform X2 [Pristis pectinata]